MIVICMVFILPLQIKQWEVPFFGGAAYLSNWCLSACCVHQLENNVRSEMKWLTAVT